MGLSVSAFISLGARALERDISYGLIPGCTTPSCDELNTLTAFLDVLYCLVVYVLVHGFVRYARRLDVLDDERTVRVEDYTLMLYGLEGIRAASPNELRVHVEASLRQHATILMTDYQKLFEHHEKKAKSVFTCRKKYHRGLANLNAALQRKWAQFLDEKSEKVADVTMIVRDRGLLRGLVKLVPLEKKVATLKHKLDIADVTEAKCSKWSIGRELKGAEKKLEKRKAQVDQIADAELLPSASVDVDPSTTSGPFVWLVACFL